MSSENETALLGTGIIVPPPSQGRKDAWDKADIAGKLLGSILIPVAVAVAGFSVDSSIQARASKGKTNEIAVTVLQSKDANIPELRAWARSVFFDMVTEADRSLPAGAIEELQKFRLPSALPSAATVDLSTNGGFTPIPIRDQSGLWYIGYGHTDGVTKDTRPVTEGQARLLLVEDLQNADRLIDSVIVVPLSSGQRGALADFILSAGEEVFLKSKISELINSGQMDQVPNEFAKTISPQVQFLHPALKQRRDAEIELWKKGDR